MWVPPELFVTVWWERHTQKSVRQIGTPLIEDSHKGSRCRCPWPLFFWNIHQSAFNIYGLADITHRQHEAPVQECFLSKFLVCVHNAYAPAHSLYRCPFLIPWRHNYLISPVVLQSTWQCYRYAIFNYFSISLVENVEMLKYAYHDDLTFQIRLSF